MLFVSSLINYFYMDYPIRGRVIFLEFFKLFLLVIMSIQ